MMKLLVIALLATSALALPFRHRRFQWRIVGGEFAEQGQFPYQIGFQDTILGYALTFCGASIYNEFTMVSAAHCVQGEDLENPKYLQIVAGEVDLNVESGYEQTREVVKILQHEDYDEFTISNDVSLLFINESLVFNDNVKNIELYKEKNATGNATVSGWGATSYLGYRPADLKYVSVPIVSDAKCREAYGEYAIFDSMICAGNEDKDSCSGDSGGPMVCEDDDGNQLQCGIVSWGYKCAEPGYPGVYTEVAYFKDWIRTHARNETIGKH